MHESRLTKQRVHREVMNWLREWDKCVFKRVVQKKRRLENDPEAKPYIDHLGRPKDRVRLHLQLEAA